MSFILDALKKSESERHRHSGPVLMDVRIAPPRRRLPTWAWVIAGVLLVNLLLLVWLLWLAPDHASNPTTPAKTEVVAAPSAAPPVAVPQTVVPQTSVAPSAVAPPSAASPVLPPALSQAPVTQSPVPAATATASNPPAPAPAPPQGIDVTTLPKVQDLIAAGTALPELRLSLHVYDPVPARRYVLLNGAKLREGETTPEGLRVLLITPAGVALEWRGRRMFLSAGG